MLDGPYGGCSVDLGTYETVVLVAGGSGITFTLGLLDDLVGRCVNLGRRGGERTRVVEFIWYIRDFCTYFLSMILFTRRPHPSMPASFSWFKAMLMDVAQLATDPSSRLDLRCTIFVTRPCEPEDITQMPGLSVLVQKPSATTLLDGVLSWRSSAPSDLESSGASSIFPPSSSAEVDPAATSAEVEGLLSEEGLDNKDSEKDVIVGESGGSGRAHLPGGVGVCAAGPASLTADVSNAVTMLSLKRGLELGGVDLHTEMYSI